MAFIELKVAGIPPTNQNDTGRGIVRLDSRSMRATGISPGDPIEIFGSKKTFAIVQTAYPSDVGLGVIRMDGRIRANAGVIVGEKIRVSPAKTKPAEKIIISPIGKVKLNITSNLLSKILVGRVLTEGDMIMLRSLPKDLRQDYTDELEVVIPFFGTQMKFVVQSVEPEDGVMITPDSIVSLGKALERPDRKPVVVYEDIGGMGDTLKKIREIVELPLKRPELFTRLGIEPPKGVLLHGPPGTGKTLLAKAVANETNAYFMPINGPEIVSKFAGEAETKLRQMFAEAEKKAPSIIFIDELDTIAQKREDVYSAESRVVAQLLTLLDGMQGRGQVIVLAATNRPDVIDSALRRPGRFDREIAIGVPDRNGRKEILQIHTRGMPLAEGVDLEKIAELTPGFTGADLAGLCKEAALVALRRIAPDINMEEKVPEDVLKGIRVSIQDFTAGLRMIEPSAMREVLVEIPNIGWSDIGGLEDIKRELKEAVELPLTNPELFMEMGIKAPNGLLLYGPPGCGKTLLVKAVANETNANFISIKGPEVLSKWVGESERAVREIFKKARQIAPSIVFFDEVDAIAVSRGSDANRVTERVLNQILTELDGIESREGVVFIAATNRPELVDSALLRPGRVDRFIFVASPDRAARLSILKVKTNGMPLDKQVKLEKIADETDDFSGADLDAVCREAAMFAIREKRKKVNVNDFQQAIEKVGPTMSGSLLEYYEKVQKKFRVRVPKQEDRYTW
ncbi:MAG: CDC48 family AAA ATPase [Candidatus Altiarchaeota archaeon]|nr:CDC48 family AAA ATPase [Candidatus Altiarchaeota archaeon]